jgi:hypothetical protein
LGWIESRAAFSRCAVMTTAATDGGAPAAAAEDGGAVGRGFGEGAPSFGGACAIAPCAQTIAKPVVAKATARTA